MNHAAKLLNRLQSAPVLTVEPGFVVETRISRGIQGDDEDLAFSVEWRDAERCQWAADFPESALAKAKITAAAVLVRDLEGVEVVFQLYHRQKRLNLPRKK